MNCSQLRPPFGSSGLTPWTLAALLLLGACWRGKDETTARPADLFTVKRGPLSISVKENANLQALRETMVRSEVEGQATVLFLVKEGKNVEQGEKLVELDSSSLLDRRTQQEITLAKAEAGRIQASKDYEILIRQNDFDLQEATNKVKFAEMDLEKFLGRLLDEDEEPEPRVALANGHKDGKAEGNGTDADPATPPTEPTSVPSTASAREMGEREQKVREAESNIQLAEAELKLAKDRYEWSVKLQEKGYITKNELEKDGLDHERKKTLLEIKRSELALLVEYTHRKTELELKQKVEDAKVEYDRVRAKNEAKIAQAEAEKKSRDAEYLLAKDRYENYVRQVENCIIKAPTKGIVVYAAQGDGMRRQEFVQEGNQVRERQQIIVLPDVSTMRADLSVHEAQIDKVQVDLPAIVKVEAFKDRIFTGKVSRVALLPDSTQRMSNPDLKVYKTEVVIDGDNKVLRPGMSASVEIIVADLKDVLFVPLQAIQRQGSVTYVWVQAGTGPTTKKVDVGLNDTTFVEITGGLTDGDQVYMAPPAGATAPTFEQPDAEARRAAVKDAPPPNRDGRPRPSADGNQAEGADGARPARQRSPAFQELIDLLKQKHPELAEKTANPMEMWRDPDVRALIDADPELKAKSDAIRAQMQQPRADRGNGERGRGPGARTPGSQQPPGNNGGR